VLRTLAIILAVLLVDPLVAAASIPAPLRHETPRFRLYGGDDVLASTRRVAAEAEQRLDLVCERIGGCDQLGGVIEVIIAEDPEAFAANLPRGSAMAEWAAGVAYPAERRIILRAHGSALFSLMETFDHEVAHVLMHARAGGRPFPRWVNEGLAIWASGEALVARLETAQSAAMTNRLIPFDELERHFPARGPRVALAYAQSGLLVRHLVRQHGPHALPSLLDEVARGEDFDRAFQRRFGAPPHEFGDAWSQDLQSSTSAVMLFRDGTVFWILMTLLFVFVAWRTVRHRRLAIERMGEEEEAAAAFDQLELQRDTDEPPTLH